MQSFHIKKQDLDSRKHSLYVFFSMDPLAQFFSSILLGGGGNCPTPHPLKNSGASLNLTELQYRSEISGLRTRKTHAPFSRKRVSKNACENARLRAFARISCACLLLLFTLITVLCVAFFFTTENKTKGNSHKRR